MIAQQELALVMGTPQFIGMLAPGYRSALRATPHATATLHQTMAIEHRMNGTLCRNGDTGESPDEALADLTSAPTGMLTLHVEDEVLHLERKLMGIAIGTSAPVCYPLNAALLVAIEDLVTGLAGDPKLSAKFRHRLAG